MADQQDFKRDESAARSAAEIRETIAARREQIEHDVTHLGSRLHETLDWRGYVVRHPYASVGLAAGAGFVLSRLLQRKPSPSERLVKALAATAEDLGEDVRQSLRRIMVHAAGPSLFRGTLYGFAGKALLQFMQSRLAHAEGNGHRRAHEADWENPHHPASTPPMMS